MQPDDEEARRHGPFHRLESPTQSPETAELQTRSGEIWGTTAKFALKPTVKAYRGPLRPGDRGVEFMTFASPDAGGAPSSPTWTPERKGVWTDGEMAKLSCVITRNTQSDSSSDATQSSGL